MVITRIWKQVNHSHLPNFIGLSLFNISIGLSVAIARTETLSFGYDDNNLELARKAVDLENEAEKLQELSTVIEGKSISKNDREKAKKITSEIIETRRKIDEVVE